MERVLVPDTPDLSFNDGDETGTSSMLSSILGRSSVEPSFSLGTESPQKAMMLPDIPEQNSQIEVEGSVSQSPAAPSSLRSSAALMRGYFGPGKYADANSSSAYHSSNNVVDVATAKKIFETIDKMQQPNIAASRGSIESLARGSASGLNQVLTALHEHDRTIRSLQTALKDIDMVAAERASQMGLASKSNFELADYSKSVLELETGVKDFQRRRTASKSIFSAPSDGVSKEWVQNEVEIQLESFRKALSLDNLKQIISQEVKRCLNPGNKSSGIKNMVEASLSRKESMISNTPQINADEIERKMMQMISDERPSVVQAAREVIESSVVDKFTSQVQELQSTFRRKAKDEAEHLVSQFQKRLDLMEKKLDKVTHTDTSRGVEIVTAIAHLDEHLACTTKEIDGIKEFKDQAQAQIRAIDERQAEICDLANSHISSDEVNDRFVKLEQQLAHLLQVSETKHEVSSDTISLAQEREEILSNEIATLKEENTAFKESMANMQEVLKTLSDQKNIKEHGELSIQMSQHLSILESVEQVSARLSELEGHVAKSRKVNDESLANLKGLVENGVDDFDFQIRTVGVSVRMLEERISQSSINPRSFVPWEFLDVSLNQIRAQIEHLDYEVANNAANTDFNINVIVFV